MKPIEEYVQQFNDAFIALLQITPTVNSVNNLISEENELEFIKAFRNLMRIKNILTSFADFSWDDLEMENQQFEDYKSKYLDLHDKVKSNTQKEKVSILDDVDFELELIHRDEINVSYILKLLGILKDSKKEEKAKKQKEILDLMAGEAHLRNKRELIERFILENLPEIEDTETIPQEFEKYWNNEQQKAFTNLVNEEKLEKTKTQKLIENYLFAEREPLREEVLDLIEGEKPSVLKRKKIGDTLIKKITGFVETFMNGFNG